MAFWYSPTVEGKRRKLAFWKDRASDDRFRSPALGAVTDQRMASPTSSRNIITCHRKPMNGDYR